MQMRNNQIGRLFYGSIQHFIRFWHHYEIHGEENIRQKNCLLVGYHSRCTVDGVYAHAIFNGITMMSPIFFTVPFSKQFFEKINCISTHIHGLSSEESFLQTILHSDRPTILYPGGHHECYKPIHEKYQVKWKELPGYSRILLSEPNRPGNETAVIPFFTRNSEDIFWTNDWWYDYSGKMVINDFHEFENGKFWLLPFLFPKSIAALGFVFLPKPVKLDLFIGKPIIPKENETSIEFAERVRNSLQNLIDSNQFSQSDPHDSNRTLRSYILSHPFYSLFTFFQMSLFWTITIALNIILVPFLLLFQSIGSFFRVKKTKKQ